MLILGIDPGGTTGLALFNVELDLFPELLWVRQIPDSHRGFIEFARKMPKPDLIVCESFKLREGLHGVDLSPTYVIGALEALHGDVKIIYQEPKMKPLCSDERLKKMGLYKAANGHAMDAVRHVIIYLRNVKHMPTLEIGWK